MDQKIKHLEMIEANVTKMGNNSFLLKGWCVTIVSALIALGAKDTNNRFIIVGYYPVVMFWLLDSYFLLQERLFRALYDKVRLLPDDATVDFSMDLASVEGESWVAVALSKTILLFYGTMVGAILLAIFVVRSV